MLEIECAGEKLILLPEKAIFWPRERMLVVADLHFGKSATFRKFGLAVPESTTATDLGRFNQLLMKFKSKRLVILGDFFHASDGRQVEMMDAVGEWCRKNSDIEMILVPGNHDQRSGPPPECWKIKSEQTDFNVKPFLFRHHPADIPGHYVLAGHVHPAISLSEKYGSGLRAPCFVFGKHQAILPAFGSFTGNHTVKPMRGERIFAIGENEIVEINPEHK